MGSNGERKNFTEAVTGLLKNLTLEIRIPQEMLTSEEQEIYGRWYSESSVVQDEIEDKYGEDYPDELEDFITDEACRRVPGSAEILDKVVRIGDQFKKTSGRDSLDI